MRKLSLLGALLFSACCFSASAQEFKPGFYGVAAGGSSTIKYSTLTIKGNTYHIGAGYDFNKNISAELTVGSISNFGIANGSTTLDYDVRSTHIAGIFKVPLGGSLIPYGYLGRATGSQSISASSSSYSSSAGSSGSKTLIGAGLEIPLEERSSIRIQYIKSSNSATSSTQLSTLTAGFVLRF